MKRLLSLALALLLTLNLALLPGCGQNVSGASAQKDGATLSTSGGKGDTAPTLLTDKTPEVQRVRQYGAAEYVTELAGALTVRVERPVGDVAGLDEAVTQWISSTADVFRTTLAGAGKSGSFNATYDSFRPNDRVVCVHMTGSLAQANSPRPQRLCATFNYDCHDQRLLALGDLLSADGDKALLSLAGEALTSLDALEGWALTDQGLRLYLPDGTSLDLSYAQLQGILTLPVTPEPEPEPEPKPEPEPEPIVLPDVDFSSLYQGEIDPSKPMVALSFDDGPYTKVTSRILDTLSQYGARATFFVVGERVAQYADTLNRIVSEGHEVGIHTWSHAKLTKLSADEIRAQVMDTYHAVLNTAGFKCAVVRPPGGSHNEFVRNTIGAEGLYLANWSVDSEDWRSRDAASVYNEIMSAVKDGSIILCHDLYESTAEAMELVIPALIAEGYQIVSVSELLTYRKGTVEAGKLYNHA